MAKRQAAYLSEFPGEKLLHMGIGDVTRPLFPSVIAAMHQAVDEMASAGSFRGYAPEQGYSFLRELIAQNDFAARGADIQADEIFVSDGAKTDCANIGDLFGPDNVVAVCDPVYPVYVDSSAMSGRAGDYENGRWTKLQYLPCTESNGFMPALPTARADLIWLCFRTTPRGRGLPRELQKWVDYCNEHDSVLLFDAAYEAYITDPDIPHTIYELPGAERCAIEFRSFSKSAGFTGTRCAYTVIPRSLCRGGMNLNDMWFRRQSTKFNGVPYVVQRGAAAVYSEHGRREQQETLAYYRENARIIRRRWRARGFGTAAASFPLHLDQAPAGLGSWEAFDLLLHQAKVIITPGAGFGACGEGYIRATAFGNAENTRIAASRLAAALR
jgi:LL-diaminopimelate aminotransferase